ncbi:MAG: helix-turn-helix transcriptional regulator [Solirubrobacterales bacterium]
MTKRKRAYPRIVTQAASLLGSEIRQARIDRRWTVRELAERAGISPHTLLRVEKGDPGVSLGVAFDVANLVGVPLFYEEPQRLSAELERSRERARLLPRRVRQRPAEFDDEF